MKLRGEIFQDKCGVAVIFMFIGVMITPSGTIVNSVTFQDTPTSNYVTVPETQFDKDFKSLYRS